MNFYEVVTNEDGSITNTLRHFVDTGHKITIGNAYDLLITFDTLEANIPAPEETPEVETPEDETITE